MLCFWGSSAYPSKSGYKFRYLYILFIFNAKRLIRSCSGHDLTRNLSCLGSIVECVADCKWELTATRYQRAFDRWESTPNLAPVEIHATSRRVTRDLTQLRFQISFRDLAAQSRSHRGRIHNVACLYLLLHNFRN